MKFQNVYEVENLDFDATYENLCSKLPGVVRTRVGRKPKPAGAISFRLYPAKIEVQIFPRGPPFVVQVGWENEKEKADYFPLLQSLLVPLVADKPVTLNPRRVNILGIEYPGPRKLSFAWCKHKINYVRQMGFWHYLRSIPLDAEERREKRIRELTAQVQAEIEIAELVRDDPELQEKKWKIRKKWRKRYGFDY